MSAQIGFQMTLMKTIRTVIALSLCSTAVPVLSSPTEGEQFAELKEQYARILKTYPEKRKSLLERMLADYLESSKQRYEQERAASNLKGMGVAKVAVKTIEDAQTELSEKGDFDFPGNLRRELKDFFDQIEKSKSEIVKNIDSRRERLRRNTFARFAGLYRKAAPDISDDRLIGAFEEWIADAKGGSDAEQEQAQEPKEDQPSISASELGLDLFTEKFAKLKEGYRSNIERLQKLRVKAQTDFLEDEEQQARDGYAEQKRVRNVKGMAVAGKIVNLLDEAIDELSESGEFVFPDKGGQRPEVKDFISGLEGRLEQQIAPYEKKQNEIVAEGLRRFGLLAREQVPDLDSGDLETIFSDWIAGNYKSSTGAPESPAKAVERQSQPGTADRLYFVQSADADDWFKVGTFKVDSRGMDIFSIPIYANRDIADTKQNVISSTRSNWSYEHSGDLQQRRYYSFRLKRLKDFEPVSVVAWPSQRNNWSIEVRTGIDPAQYGFELEAGVAVGPDGRAVAKERFDIDVVSDPAGARVYVDGERRYPPGDDFVTPLTIALEKGEYDVALRKDDYLPSRIDSFTAEPRARIEASLTHESELPGQRVMFSPGKSWHRTKVEVETGDKIWIVAEGNWTIGRKGEAVGPQGYPRGEYSHYYGGELRKNRQAKYGALLMKIGEEYYGAPSEVEDKRAIVVNQRVGVTAKTWGEIWLDVNEREDADLRRDNRGSFKLRIVVLPGGEVPSGN